jgi:hypothetical protein
VEMAISDMVIAGTWISNGCMIFGGAKVESTTIVVVLVVCTVLCFRIDRTI